MTTFRGLRRGAHSKILHVDDAVRIGERERVGFHFGEAQAEIAVDDFVYAVDAVVHQHAAFSARGTDAGDANRIDEGADAFVVLRRGDGSWGC